MMQQQLGMSLLQKIMKKLPLKMLQLGPSPAMALPVPPMALPVPAAQQHLGQVPMQQLGRGFHHHLSLLDHCPCPQPPEVPEAPPPHLLPPLPLSLVPLDQVPSPHPGQVPSCHLGPAPHQHLGQVPFLLLGQVPSQPGQMLGPVWPCQ